MNWTTSPAPRPPQATGVCILERRAGSCIRLRGSDQVNLLESIRNKRHQAEFFLWKIKEDKQAEEQTINYFSAFLTEGRSVLSIAGKGIKINPEAKAWFDSQYGRFPILEEFKEIRNTNLKDGPFRPGVEITPHPSEVCFADEVSVQGGKIICDENTFDSSPPKKKREEKPEAKARYLLRIDGVEKDLFSFCKEYLDTVKNIIEEGIQLGYLKNS